MLFVPRVTRIPPFTDAITASPAPHGDPTLSALMPDPTSSHETRRRFPTVTQLDDARERHARERQTLRRTPTSPYGREHIPVEARNCENHDRPEIFSPRDHAELVEAIDTCAPCPVRDACEAQGRANGEWGVWGGVFMREGRTAHRFTRDKERWLFDLDVDAESRDGGAA